VWLLSSVLFGLARSAATAFGLTGNAHSVSSAHASRSMLGLGDFKVMRTAHLPIVSTEEIGPKYVSHCCFCGVSV
jgi:hypothetical protein